jgi:DNA-binding XRE family transcriptional regulator
VHYSALSSGFKTKTGLKTSKSAIKRTIHLFYSECCVYLLKKSSIMHFERMIKQLKERREALQVTQEMLSDISGVSLRTLKQFESGKGNPTLDTLTKLSEALGLEVCLQVKAKQPDA